MAVRKKTTKTKTTKTSTKSKKAASRSFKISYQGVGSLAESVTIKSGTTLGDFVNERNLKDYTVSLNGSSSSLKTTLLSKGDVIRIGSKHKNA